MTGNSDWIPILDDMINSDGSVSDKYGSLPNEDWIVYVTCRDNGGITYVTLATLEYDGCDSEHKRKYAWYYDFSGSKIKDTVIAWMKFNLPKPYTDAH